MKKRIKRLVSLNNKAKAEREFREVKLQKLSNQTKQVKQEMVRWMIVIGLKIFSFLIFCLPWKVALWVGKNSGRVAYSILKKERERAWRNFNLAFGNTFDENKKREILRRSFENLGKCLVEILKFSQINEKNIDQKVRIQGEECLRKAFANNKGIVFVTGHVGNWELMGIALSIKGFPTNVVAAPLYDSRLANLMNQFRLSHGVKTITRGREKSARKILSALKNNEILGLLIDQDTHVEGVFVNFFNRKAFTPSGAASLALKSGASVILGFIHRDSNDFHTVTLTGPVSLIQGTDREKNIHDNTSYFTQIIEENIKRNPDQWIWMHDRWNTRSHAEAHEFT